jgi:hypothetical protein
MFPVRTLLVLALALAALPVPARGVPASPTFSQVFQDGTLRLDFTFTVNAREERVSLDGVCREGTCWAGPRVGLATPLEYGRYSLQVHDEASRKLLYATGFDGIFGEYRTTAPAEKGELRGFHRGLRIPFPKAPVRLVLQARDRQNRLQTLLVRTLKPSEARRGTVPPDVSVTVIQRSGPVRDHVDLAFLAEGYTVEERDKFVADVTRLTQIFWTTEPYQALRNRFNVYAVFRPSLDSGVTEPREGRLKRTALGSSFNALGLDRYLLVDDERPMREVASAAPYDALIVLVNSTRYGGGGIYNDYAISTAGNALSPKVLLHEFGHAFGGLGDEYFGSTVSYTDFYPAGQEPLEPNLTADPLHPKWGGLLSPGLPLPTPWEAEERARLAQAQRALRAEQAKALEGVTPAQKGSVEARFSTRLAELQAQSEALKARLAPLAGKVGAFEGAGYSAKGLYRASLDCLMFSNAQDSFCPVCQDGIARVARYLCEGK